MFYCRLTFSSCCQLTTNALPTKSYIFRYDPQPRRNIEQYHSRTSKKKSQNVAQNLVAVRAIAMLHQLAGVVGKWMDLRQWTPQQQRSVEAAAYCRLEPGCRNTLGDVALRRNPPLLSTEKMPQPFTDHYFDTKLYQCFHRAVPTVLRVAVKQAALITVMLNESNAFMEWPHQWKTLWQVGYSNREIIESELAQNRICLEEKIWRGVLNPF